MFSQGAIADVIIKDLQRHIDDRGWLVELFREDELPAVSHPVMAYLSMTKPGIVRGPHEHVDQTDYFAFVGSSTFRIYMWDNRPESPTYRVRQVVEAGGHAPRTVIIPPGVVHAYKNIGKDEGIVINMPDRLYAGYRRREPVDEVRHEQDPHTPFVLD